jgi:hypothetical protein
MSEEQETKSGVDRREFVAKAGKFAPLAPAVTFLLSTSMTSDAIASSGGRPTPQDPQRPRRRPRRRRNHGHGRTRRN